MNHLTISKPSYTINHIEFEKGLACFFVKTRIPIQRLEQTIIVKHFAKRESQCKILHKKFAESNLHKASERKIAFVNVCLRHHEQKNPNALTINNRSPRARTLRFRRQKITALVGLLERTLRSTTVELTAKVKCIRVTCDARILCGPNNEHDRYEHALLALKTTLAYSLSLEAGVTEQSYSSHPHQRQPNIPFTPLPICPLTITTVTSQPPPVLQQPSPVLRGALLRERQSHELADVPPTLANVGWGMSGARARWKRWMSERSSGILGHPGVSAPAVCRFLRN